MLIRLFVTHAQRRRWLPMAALLVMHGCDAEAVSSADSDSLAPVPDVVGEVAASDTLAPEELEAIETGACESGATEVLVPALDGPQRIVTDGAFLYWTDDRGLWRSDLEGAGKVSLASDNNIRGLVVDGTHCYFGVFEQDIRRVSKVPGGASEHFAGDAGHKVSNPTAFAIDATHVYWADAYFDSVSRAALDGSGTTTLLEAKTRPGGIVADEPSRLAINSTKVFWTTLDGQVGIASKDGTNALALVVPRAELGGIAADETHVYWIGDGIYRANIDGSDITLLAATAPSRRNGLVIDETRVYVLGRNGFGIVPKVGGPRIDIAYPFDRPSNATDLLVRDSAIIWTHDPGFAGDGAVLRTCIP